MLPVGTRASQCPAGWAVIREMFGSCGDSVEDCGAT